ncbi:MAG: helix-turn-helix domain-containing protein [Actinomycetota bacterium]
MPEPTDLRTRRHHETRDAILDAAITMFERHGFTEVTMEQIAAAASVSRRTAYRRFRSKDDILLELPRRWLGAFDEFVAEHRELPVVELIEGACLAVSAYIDAHRHETLVGIEALAAAPGLNSTSVAHDDWHRRIEGLLVDAGVDAVDAALLAGAGLGGIDAMLAVWAAQGGDVSLVDLNRRLNERLRPMWPR